MRKKETVVVPTQWGGRDAEKAFLITEKSAVDAEKWAWRLFIACKGSAGIAPIPDELAKFGMLGVAIRGLNAFLAAPIHFEDVEPLLDELLTCVQIIRDRQHPEVATPIMPDDIDEVRTVSWLRSEVLRVHTGFSCVDALSSLLALASTAPSPVLPTM